MKKTLWPFASAILGLAALWYAWFKIDGAGGLLPWFGWIRLGLLGAAGLLFLAASVLMLRGGGAGETVFRWGWTTIALALFVGLLALVAKLAGRLLGADWPDPFEGELTNPSNLIIPAVVLALVLLGKPGGNHKADKP